MRNYKRHSKTFQTPRRPFEKERLDRELKLCGEFGLRAKKEIWRVQLVLAKIRKTALLLNTLDEDDPKRMLQGAALLRRMQRLGLLANNQNKLDYILSLTTEDFLKRRLQSVISQLGHARSIHHARVLIRQRHIRVGNQLVNVPSFLVRRDSEKHIGHAITSPIGGGRPGRKARSNAKVRAAKAARESAEAGSGSDGEDY